MKGPGTVGRDLSPDVVFPSGSSAHGIGLALGGSFWDLRTSLEAAHGNLGVLVAENLYSDYVNLEFRNVEPLEELDERAGERVVMCDETEYGGSHRQFIVDAFLPHNLYRLPFIRGDCNGDGAVDISDVSKIGGVVNGEVPGCYDACDADGDNDVDSDDQTYLSEHLFQGGPAPPGPYPGCGEDPASQFPGDDTLTCMQSPCPDE